MFLYLRYIVWCLVDSRLGHEKEHFVRYHLYCFFKTLADDLN